MTPEMLVLIAEAHAEGATQAALFTTNSQSDAYAKGARVAAELLANALPVSRMAAME